ncbi:NUDIX domain-containing protein [Isoptericola sediminis]|uniref:NUDIX domain-containing protein n=1 Tax=Isoptericola sediminis TaxID=2733572 RepID=A0A849KC23_9MICO|nr:NUDIX domain-containing protein [Isoptericola sediminis]
MTAAATTLHIVAAVIVRHGRWLLVRKQRTGTFIQVGGKIEAGESPRDALLRECAEEIGLDADPSRVRALGQHHATAANEPDHVVDAHVFELELPTGFEPRALAELAELRWVDPHDPVTPFPVAPLSQELMSRFGAGRPRTTPG